MQARIWTFLKKYGAGLILYLDKKHLSRDEESPSIPFRDAGKAKIMKNCDIRSHHIGI